MSLMKIGQALTSCQRQSGLAAALLAATGALAAGCTDSRATKAGKTTGPTVLHLANGYADLTYERAVAYFVDRVRQLSRGSLRIEVESDWGVQQGTPRPGFEQRLVRDVAD